MPLRSRGPMLAALLVVLSGCATFRSYDDELRQTFPDSFEVLAPPARPN